MLSRFRIPLRNIARGSTIQEKGKTYDIFQDYYVKISVFF